MNYEYLTIEDAQKIANGELTEEKAVEYLNNIEDRVMLTEREVDLSNLCIKYKKEYFGLLELYNIHIKDLEKAETRNNKAIEKYEKCKEEDYCTLALDMYNILRGEDNE